MNGASRRPQPRNLTRRVKFGPRSEFCVAKAVPHPLYFSVVVAIRAGQCGSTDVLSQEVGLLMTGVSWKVFVWTIAVSLIIPETVAAYLDPGSGSMLLQGLIAVIAAVLGAIGVYWRRLYAFIRRTTGKASASGPDGPTDS